jgi:hypothetical protein
VVLSTADGNHIVLLRFVRARTLSRPLFLGRIAVLQLGLRRFSGRGRKGGRVDGPKGILSLSKMPEHGICMTRRKYTKIAAHFG